MHVCGDFCSHTGTEGWGFGYDNFLFFFTLNISPGLRGGHPLADESLLTVTAILIRIQAERESKDFFSCVSTFLYHRHFSRAAGGKPTCRGSLFTVAVILVCI